MGEDISRLMDGEIDEGEQDVVWAKLKAMSDGARIASDRLFRGG